MDSVGNIGFGSLENDESMLTDGSKLIFLVHFNALTSDVRLSKGQVYFVHNNRPCECILGLRRAIHLFDVMDVLHILPSGFQAYILATNPLRDSYREKLDRAGMSHVQTKLVPYHHSNLMNRMKASSVAKVRTIGYFGSRPSLNMLQSVKKLLDTYYHEIQLTLELRTHKWDS